MTVNSENKEQVMLDDIMIAMDVVDTLRHDEKLVDRELNAEERREDLIRRLRDLYKSQGIEVPDHLLMEGVQALEDGRFTYEPPKDSFMLWLAKIYVGRQSWGKTVMLLLGAVIVLWFAIEWFKPQPPDFASLVAQVQSESQTEELKSTALTLGNEGGKAFKAGNKELAERNQKKLQDMLQTLRAEYSLQIVTRKGVLSAVRRVPKVNQQTRNYYLIVEAVSPSGERLERTIKSEETGKSSNVKQWGVRVSQDIYETVKQDKLDDGIIQNKVVARKKRGFLKEDMIIQTQPGYIIKW